MRALRSRTMTRLGLLHRHCRTRCGSLHLGRDAPECAAQGENQEADPREQERDSDNNAEERDVLCKEGDVQRGRKRRLGHPDIPGAVRDRLTVVVLRCGCLVARPSGIIGVGGGLEPAHLGVREAAGALEP